MTCVVDGCEKPRCNSRGWCWKHYMRWYRGQRITDPTLAERLTDGADISGGPGACWEWQGTRSTNGYGMVGKEYAHRAMLSLVVGRDLADGEFACHHCDNPPCINPRHLFVGNAAENIWDMVEKGRHGGRYYDLPLEDIRWLYERHVSPDRIADLFGVAGIVIRLRIRELGLPARRPGRPTNREAAAADQALALYQAGTQARAA